MEPKEEEENISKYLIKSKNAIKKMKPKDVLNINIGLLGHVDSGKTALARALSMITSTAALDKNP